MINSVGEYLIQRAEVFRSMMEGNAPAAEVVSLTGRRKLAASGTQKLRSI